MTKVLILGSTGMLGSAVLRQANLHGLDVLEASRTRGLRFDAFELQTRELIHAGDLSAGDYIVNCVGLTKSHIEEGSMDSHSKAVRLNVDFPISLAVAAQSEGVKVLQVATDCVFSGVAGSYSETATHDPWDVYGKTKSLGEVPSPAVMHLRCSLIGPEVGRKSLFFEWIRQQPSRASIQGYANHYWNGLTSDVFGKIVAGIVSKGLFTAGVQHLVPRGKVSKNDLVRLVLEGLGRGDVEVSTIDAVQRVDRTLATQNIEVNRSLFAAAGYKNLPTIGQMVRSLCIQLAD